MMIPFVGTIAGDAAAHHVYNAATSPGRSTSSGAGAGLAPGRRRVSLAPPNSRLVMRSSARGAESLEDGARGATFQQ